MFEKNARFMVVGTVWAIEDDNARKMINLDRNSFVVFEGEEDNSMPIGVPMLRFTYIQPDHNEYSQQGLWRTPILLTESQFTTENFQLVAID